MSYLTNKHTDDDDEVYTRFYYRLINADQFLYILNKILEAAAEVGTLSRRGQRLQRH